MSCSYLIQQLSLLVLFLPPAVLRTVPGSQKAEDAFTHALSEAVKSAKHNKKLVIFHLSLMWDIYMISLLLCPASM